MPYLIWYAVCICEAAEEGCECQQATVGTAEAGQERPLLALQEEQVLAEALAGCNLPRREVLVGRIACLQ